MCVQAVLDAEKARKEEEKRLKAEAEQRRLLGTPEAEAEPEPEPEPEEEGEPEPVPEKLERLVQEHFRPIKLHAEAVRHPHTHTRHTLKISGF